MKLLSPYYKKTKFERIFFIMLNIPGTNTDKVVELFRDLE